MKPTTRILLPNPDGGFSVLELPTRAVVMSLLNDATAPEGDKPRTTTYEAAWANGDGVEITLRRVPYQAPR